MSIWMYEDSDLRLIERILNEVSKVLHNMVGTEQRITFVYNPQLYGVCERQNGAIKDYLKKLHDGNPCD